MLDEAARSNLGFESGDQIGGAIPIRLAGRVGTVVRPRRPLHRRGRSDVGADRRASAGLGQAVRQAGARDLHADDQAAIDPHRRSADRRRRRRRQGYHRSRRRGRSCNRPISRPTASPTATAPASRSNAATDGALRVIMRGDVYDGRGFVKSAAGGATPRKPRQAPPVDVDLDIKLGAVARLQRRSAARHRSENVAPRPARFAVSGSPPRSAAMRRSPAICAAGRAAARWSIWRPATPARSSASPTSIRA